MNSQQTQGDNRPHSTQLGQLWEESWGLVIVPAPHHREDLLIFVLLGRIPSGHISVPPDCCPSLVDGEVVLSGLTEAPE